MPQPAGPQDAEAFVGRSRELAVLSAALHQAAIRSAIAKVRDRAPAAAAHLDRSIRTGTRCSYTPPDG
jgi:hypothetical protein